MGWPPVSRMERRRPLASAIAWIFVLRPPRERPIAWFCSVAPPAAALQHMQDAADHAAVVHPSFAAHVSRQIRLNLPPWIVAQPKQIAPHLSAPNHTSKENQQPIQPTTNLLGSTLVLALVAGTVPRLPEALAIPGAITIQVGNLRQHDTPSQMCQLHAADPASARCENMALVIFERAINRMDGCDDPGKVTKPYARTTGARREGATTCCQGSYIAGSLFSGVETS